MVSTMISSSQNEVRISAQITLLCVYRVQDIQKADRIETSRKLVGYFSVENQVIFSYF